MLETKNKFPHQIFWRGNKGFTLIMAIFLAVALLVIFTSLSHMLFSSAFSLFNQKDALRAYYLAEAAVEYGKAKLQLDPDWCSPGTKITVKDGSFEVKKKKEQSFLYGVGYANRARAIIKLDVIDHHTYLQREE